MQTMELLERALNTARERGYHVRLERLANAAGGACVVGGRKLLFLEVTATAREQLDVVLAALRAEDDLPRQVRAA